MAGAFMRMCRCRCKLLLVVVVVVVLSGAHVARAFPVFRGMLPGGMHVPCPDGVEGCSSNGLCEGLGHGSCLGGSLPLNPFGEAFRDALFQWDETLCGTDSDGDGYSNGVELGDPCCLFGTEDFSESYGEDVLALFNGVVSASAHEDGPGSDGGRGNAAARVSHPGFAHANPETVGSAYAGLAADVIADMCARYIADDMPTHSEEEREEESASHREDPYLDGERRVTLEVQFPTIEIPARETTYGCSYIDLHTYVDDPSVPYHLVGFKVNIDNFKFAHHMLLKVCDSPGKLKHFTSETYDDGCLASFKKHDTKCLTVIAGWNPGGWSDTKNGVFSFPAEAGYPVIGRGARFIAIETHYTNIQRETGATDASNIDLYVTPDLRPHDSGTMMLGPITGQVHVARFLRRTIPLGFSPIAVPPGMKAYEMKADCHVPEPITIWATRGHGHLNMASLYIEQRREQSKNELRGGGAGRIVSATGARTPVSVGGVDEKGLELVHRFAKIRQFDYNYQPVSYTGGNGINVESGDTLRSFCIFNTEDRSDTVFGGASTFDEMCINYVFYYPAILDDRGRSVPSCIDWKTFRSTDLGENPFESGEIQ